MRLPTSAHASRPWRIHELTRDFRLEDVWALPTPGGRDDFGRLVDLMTSGEPAHESSRVIVVKPNGVLGTAYMTAIRPFRHPAVYPAMLRRIEREWGRVAGGSGT